MLKICFVCGTKENKLYDGMCEKCIKERFPPIAEIKPINLKRCNMCKKIHFQNALYNLDEIEDMLPNIVKKKITLNKNYVLKDLKIDDLDVFGDDLVFDVSVDCELKN